MVSIKVPNRLDEAVNATKSIRAIADRRARTRGAANKARRVAAWVARQAGPRREPKQNEYDEQALFAALQTCAHRATNKARGKSVPLPETHEWAERWRLIRDYLINQNLGLAYAMLARFRTSQVDRDDLRGEAFLTLVRTVERYDPWRGFRFSTYACQAIVRAMIQVARKSSRYGLSCVAEPQAEPEPDGEKNRWSELYADRLRSALTENRGELTERESTVLAGRFPLGGGVGRTLAQVGDALGLSKERVRQIQKSALAKLRDVLEADPVLQ